MLDFYNHHLHAFKRSFNSLRKSEHIRSMLELYFIANWKLDM